MKGPPFRAPLERLRARLEPPPAGPAADRPGGIEAVGAKYDAETWAVLLLRQGEEIAFVSANKARALAADMVRIADAIEGRVP